MRLILCVATMDSSPLPGDIASWMDLAHDKVAYRIHYNSPSENLGVVGSYEQLYRETTEDILCYIHDDVICNEEGWDDKVQLQFEDPAVGMVGFGGALRHGSPILYKIPYRLEDLARFGYLSNTDDAEQHGARFRESIEVAVLDGFALCIRRSLLDRVRGWSFLRENSIDFICYDYAICALARRHRYRIRMVGIRCHHRGGQTSTKVNQDRQEEYERSHYWFYREFADVMPCQTR